MDKGFLTHYMICKYIDDLPNSWCTEDLTNATGDITAAGNESVLDSELRNEHAFSTKGLNETNESNAETNTTTTQETGSEAKLVNKFAFGDAYFQSAGVETGFTTQSSSASPRTPKPLLNKSNEDDDVNESLKLSDQHIKRINMPPIANSSAPNITDQPAFITAKKLYSNSSRSHSKIVLFDENDDEDPEDDSILKTKITAVGSPIPAASKSADFDIIKPSVVTPHPASHIGIYSSSSQASSQLPVVYARFISRLFY